MVIHTVKGKYRQHTLLFPNTHTQNIHTFPLPLYLSPPPPPPPPLSDNTLAGEVCMQHDVPGHGYIHFTLHTAARGQGRGGERHVWQGIETSLEASDFTVQLTPATNTHTHTQTNTTERATDPQTCCYMLLDHVRVRLHCTEPEEVGHDHVIVKNSNKRVKECKARSVAIATCRVYRWILCLHS